MLQGPKKAKKKKKSKTGQTRKRMRGLNWGGGTKKPVGIHNIPDTNSKKIPLRKRVTSLEARFEIF